MRQPKRELSYGGKLSDQTIWDFVKHFAWGQRFDEVAATLDISRKSVRGLAANLRTRLLTPVFNPWHMTLDPWPSEPTQDISPHEMLTFVLMHCAGRTCRRNFSLGNVRNRQCRACILRGYIEEEEAKSHLSRIDEVHEFYELLGWRNDNWRDSRQSFLARSAHYLTVKNAALHSRKLKSGLGDPSERGYLTTGSLIERLTDDLAANPLPFAPTLVTPPPNTRAAVGEMHKFYQRIHWYAIGNDYFRRTLNGGSVALSFGVRRLDKATRELILAAIQAFNDFDIGPFEERNTGWVRLPDIEPIRWTIDYSDHTELTSPSDPQLWRTLQIELESEVPPPRGEIESILGRVGFVFLSSVS